MIPLDIYQRGEEGRGNDYEVTILRSLCMDNFLEGFSFGLELGSIASSGLDFCFLTFLIASFGWDETIDTPLFFLFIK